MTESEFDRAIRYLVDCGISVDEAFEAADRQGITIGQWLSNLVRDMETEYGFLGEG